MSSLDALTGGYADLGLVENSVAFVPGLRAVLPVFESVLHIAFRDEFEPTNLDKPLMGAHFYVANDSAAGKEFVRLVTKRQRISEQGYHLDPLLRPGVTDIIIYLARSTRR